MLPKISDIIVRITVNQPAPLLGMGQPVIFSKGSKEGYKEYESLVDLNEDYAITTAVYKKASAILAQSNRPRKFAVATFDKNIVDVATKYFFESWHFALLAEYDGDDALALSNFLEEQQFKFLVVQVDKASELDTLEGNMLTIAAVHDKQDEYLDAAVVGNTANLTVGSVTWKNRANLVGITPIDISVSELNILHRKGGFAYVRKAGIPQTSEGKTVGGEFIDALHGDHWVKASIETNLQRLLTDMDKVDLASAGIAQIRSTAEDTLVEAHGNGIIDTNDEDGLPNYEVDAAPRSELDPEDIARREYKGLSFRYKRSSAIHSATVQGIIEE